MTTEPSWIQGTDFRDAGAGPFNALLRRIGEVAGTSDRRTIAASFAFRFGWSSVVAIAPYLQSRWLPDVALDNVSFAFGQSTAFERAALHAVRGVVVAGDPRAADPSMTTVPDAEGLRRALRDGLVAQAAPVVAALERWSGFAARGTWGQLTSAWASQFTTLAAPRNDQRGLVAELDAFFAGDDIVAAMRPLMHAVSVDGAIHLRQRRASCCRLYLLPGGELCTSCPLVGRDVRSSSSRLSRARPEPA